MYREENPIPKNFLGKNKPLQHLAKAKPLEMLFLQREAETHTDVKSD